VAQGAFYATDEETVNEVVCVDEAIERLVFNGDGAAQ
jgi:hypothetical protein